MGAKVVRKVRNKEYLYYVYYNNRERKDVYCGLVTDPKSKEKLRDVEINELQTQKEKITVRIKELKNK